VGSRSACGEDGGLFREYKCIISQEAFYKECMKMARSQDEFYFHCEPLGIECMGSSLMDIYRNHTVRSNAAHLPRFPPPYYRKQFMNRALSVQSR